MKYSQRTEIDAHTVSIIKANTHSAAVKQPLTTAPQAATEKEITHMDLVKEVASRMSNTSAEQIDQQRSEQRMGVAKFDSRPEAVDADDGSLTGIAVNARSLGSDPEDQDDQNDENAAGGATGRSLDAVRRAMPGALRDGRAPQTAVDHIKAAQRACENFLGGYPEATTAEALHGAAAHLVHAISRHRGE
jgi:hypothetical protein